MEYYKEAYEKFKAEHSKDNLYEGLSQEHYDILGEYMLYVTNGVIDSSKFKGNKAKLAKLADIASLDTEWRYAGCIDAGAPVEHCTLGHRIRYMHFVEGKTTGIRIVFGSKCVTDFFDVDKEVIKELERVAKEVSEKISELLFVNKFPKYIRDYYFSIRVNIHNFIDLLNDFANDYEVDLILRFWEVGLYPPKDLVYSVWDRYKKDIVKKYLVKVYKGEWEKLNNFLNFELSSSYIKLNNFLNFELSSSYINGVKFIVNNLKLEEFGGAEILYNAIEVINLVLQTGVPIKLLKYLEYASYKLEYAWFFAIKTLLINERDYFEKKKIDVSSLTFEEKMRIFNSIAEYVISEWPNFSKDGMILQKFLKYLKDDLIDEAKEEILKYLLDNNIVSEGNSLLDLARDILNSGNIHYTEKQKNVLLKAYNVLSSSSKDLTIMQRSKLELLLKLRDKYENDNNRFIFDIIEKALKYNKISDKQMEYVDKLYKFIVNSEKEIFKEA